MVGLGRYSLLVTRYRYSFLMIMYCICLCNSDEITVT
jgi:hypothetical protein